MDKDNSSTKHNYYNYLETLGHNKVVFVVLLFYVHGKHHVRTVS